MPFQAFYETFELLGFERKWKKYAMCTMEDTKSYATELCTELLIPHKDYQLGHTKVYLREDSYEKLHQAIAAFYNSKAVVIQAFARRWKTRGNYKKAVKGAQMLQALARMKSQRKQFKVILHNKREQERIEAERIAAELEKLRLEQERIRLEEERYREEQEKIRAEQERLRQEELQRLAELEEVRRQEEENRLRLQAEYEARIVSLHTACEVGDFDLVKQLLLQNPDDFEQPDPTRDHRTVLQSAILGGNESLIQYLCPSVSDLNAKDMHGNSAIHYALRSKSKQKLTFLKFLTDLVEPYVFMDNLRKGIAVRPLQNSLPDVPDSDNLKYRSTLVGNIFSVEKSMELAAAKSLSARKSTVSTGSILKAGWLSKKGESQQWRKRWMVLTPDSLMYFRNNKDKIPRDSLSFSTKNEIQVLRLEENDSAIEIVINHQSMRKKRSRISFMADNETEILEWMNLIMAAAGVEPKPIRKPTGDILSLHTSSPAIKEGVLSSVNKAHDTPLHMLSQIVPETTMTVSEREELLCIAAWMVENGSPLATFNGKGFTVLHEALANGHFHLALFLAGKGSPPNFTSKKVSPDEKKVLDVAAQLGGASEEFLARLKFAFANYEFGHGTFHDPPARLRGFHYLTIGFKKHSVCLPE